MIIATVSFSISCIGSKAKKMKAKSGARKADTEQSESELEELQP